MKKINMNIIKIKERVIFTRIKSIFTSALVVNVLFGLLQVAESSNERNDFDSETINYSRVVRIEGEVITGANRLLNKPVRDFGVVLDVPVGTIGFDFLAVYNPDGRLPHLLSQDTPKSAILATYVDPEWLNLWGLTQNDVDPEMVNVPLHEVKTVVSRDGVTRQVLDNIMDSEPFSLSLVGPTESITLGDWLNASGTAVIRCTNKNLSKVEITMNNFIPNRIYSYIGVSASEDGQVELFPLGGVPNSVVTDENGDARITRKLNFCPLDIVERRPGFHGRVISLNISYRSNHAIYGAVPNLEFSGQSLLGGLVGHGHMQFSLFGEKL